MTGVITPPATTATPHSASGTVFAPEVDALSAPKRRRVRLAALGVAAAIAVGAAWLAWDQPGGGAVLAATLFAPALLAHHGVPRRQIVIMALTLGSLVAAIDYTAWRLGVTNWAAWWFAVPLLVAELFGILHALGVTHAVWPRAPRQRHVVADSSRQPIFIMVPTVNEGIAVVRETLIAAQGARRAYLQQHPHARVTIVLCNDGRVAGYEHWRDVDRLADGLGVSRVTRTVGGGAKAGNLENARQELGVTGNAIMVIFDADQIASPQFLLSTVHELDDPDIAWVQTGQYYRNLENPVALWAEHQQAIFYDILLPGKSATNAAFICGTNVVIRAAALDEIGGFPQDSVTEDFAASLELHRRWKSVFVEGRLALGLGPMDLPAYFKQQDRWAVGTLGTLRTHFLSLISPRRKGMGLQQRIQYLLAQTHYLSGLKDLIFVVAPIVFLLTGVPGVTGADIDGVFWHFLPYFLLSQAAFWTIAAGRTSVRGVLMGFGSFPTLILSLWTVITGKRTSFRITAKRRSGRVGFAHLVPHAICLMLCAVALVAVATSGSVSSAEVVSLAWVVYSALCIVGFLVLGVRDLRGTTERRATAPAPTGANALRLRLARSRNVLLGGATAVLVAAAVAVGSVASMQPAPPAAGFGSAVDGSSPLAVGAALPAGADGRALASAFPEGLDIVGRTQVIREDFDVAWAAHLEDVGSTPWITLLLGEVRDPLATNLLGVVNGVHDEDLRRWAESLRDYGRPVYLTVFPQVDAKSSVTSAVAGGGAPQDVAPAWKRVDQILEDAGASNVALMWAPALPDADAGLAPSDSQIDVVLLSLISYPGTDWADPRAAVLSAEREHPGKPLVILAGAAGDAEEKARWLRRVADVAVATPSVRALVYNESDPEAEGVEFDPGAWSLLSDPWSTRIFQSLATGTDLPNLPSTPQAATAAQMTEAR